jgi:hypothetical protein
MQHRIHIFRRKYMSEVKLQTASYWLPAQETANGIIVKLYSDHPAVEHPVVKLYDSDLVNPSEDLIELPSDLLESIQAKGIGMQADPKRDAALAKGLLVPLDHKTEFYVAVTEDGKVSKRVRWPETKELWAGRKQAGGAGGAGEQAVYAGMDSDSRELLSKVSEEAFEIGWLSLKTVGDLYHVAAQEGVDANSFGVDNSEIFKTVYYRISKIFDSVRGAWVLPLADAVDLGRQKIMDGDIDTLADDIADAHSLIEDGEAVRKIIENLNIKVTKEHVDNVNKRVELAQMVWIYADIVYKYGKSSSRAVEVINGTFDQVPF